MELFKKFVVGCILFFYAIFLAAISLSLCWDWFIIPIFHLPDLGLVECMGVSITLRAFVHGPQKVEGGGDKEEPHGLTWETVMNAAWSITSLYASLMFTAWCIHKMQ